MTGGWQLSLVGWPWWTVLPLAVLGFLGVRLLARRELLARSERERRGLLLLRGAVAALLVLIFLEPILSRQLIRRELPVVSVLVDASGSMAVCDAGMGASAQLDEAIALGLLPEEARDNSFGLAAELLEDLGQDLPALLTALERSAVGTDREAGAGAAAARLGERCGKYIYSLQQLSPRLAGQGQLGTEAEALRGLLVSSAARLGGAPGAEDARSLQQSLRALQPRVAGLVARCRKAQRAADAALVTGAGVDSPVATALGQLETMSRFERVRRLTAARLAPLFEKRASGRFRRLDRRLGPMDLEGPEAQVRLEGGTDFAGPLGALAQSSGEDRLSGVLLLSDGRQTAGGDPTPALRALRARGIRVGAVSVGDPAEPRDAAVSEILGSREVFQGETVRLDVRFRIVGYEDVPWDLILTRGGEELERRTVCGTGRWQTERFEIPAEAPGLLQFQARLEMDRKVAVAALAGTVAHWSCDDGKGLQVRDSGRQEMHGVLKGADPASVWTAGRCGRGLRFSGNERVLVEARPKLGAEWSVTCWFRAPLPEKLSRHVLVRGRDRDLQVSADSKGNLGTFVSSKGGFKPCGFNLGDLEPGWHHLAAVAQGQTTSFFIDGKVVGTCGIRSTADVYCIGNNTSGGQRFADALDEVRLHKRALTPGEVVWMMDLAEERRIERGAVVREIWKGVSAGSTAELRSGGALKRAADRSERLKRLAAGPGGLGGAASRIRGFLVPPVSGSYRFWISADRAAELWLGSGAGESRKVLAASVGEAVPPGTWDRHRCQVSRPVPLRAGDHYYVEVLHVAGRESGHVAVGWKRPDGKLERPIPGEFLEVYDPVVARSEKSYALLREASTDNNQADLMVSVNKDPLKVLLIDANPRWESRYLMTMLERDTRVKLVRRYRAVRVPRGELELLPAAQEELDSFGMVVFGDLLPEELGRGDQKRLVDFVDKRGGFLVLLAGPRALPARYSLGGIADLLPVKAAAGTAEGAPASGGAGERGAVQLALTERGSKHPVTAVLDDPALNRKLWPALPGLTWVARSVTAKAGGAVLLESSDPEKTPVAVISRFGAGRVFYLGTDESWRWRDRLGDRVHQTFWLQVMRWGLGLRLRGKDNRLQAALARSMVSPDEAAEMRARATLADGQPLAGRLVVKAVALNERGRPVEGTARELEMDPVPEGAGIQVVRLTGLGEGRWRLTVSGRHPSLEGLSEVRELLVQRQPGREGVELGANPAGLMSMARLGGHRAGGFAEAEEVVSSLLKTLKPRRVREVRTYSLWDNYLVLAAAVGLLLVEWVWRKRQGLP